MIPDQVQISRTAATAEEIWVALKEGDRAALEWLYREFSPSLFKLGFSITLDQELVQDCIQEIFLDLWKYRKTINRTDSVKLYLLRSLSNKINAEHTRVHRKEKHRSKLSIEYPTILESVEDRIILGQHEDQLRQRLAKIIQELPRRQQEVIQYLFFEDLSYEDTAKVMEINLRSVYTLTWKAITSLKRGLLTVIVILIVMFSP